MKVVNYKIKTAYADNGNQFVVYLSAWKCPVCVATMDDTSIYDNRIEEGYRIYTDAIFNEMGFKEITNG